MSEMHRSQANVGFMLRGCVPDEQPIDGFERQHRVDLANVIPPSGEPTVSRPNAALLKAIARAYERKNQLMLGKVRDHRSIARQTGLDEAYVGKILRCAYFAPDIVEAILEGKQPASLTLQRLQKPLPMNWSQQRRQLESLP